MEKDDLDALNDLFDASDGFEPQPVVLVRLAHTFYEDDARLKSHLHAVSRTSWSQIGKYIHRMQKLEYLNYNKKQGGYVPTENGWRVLKLILRLYGTDSKKKNNFE